MRRAIQAVLDIGPGLTLDTPQVQLWIDRRQRNLAQVRDRAQTEAEIRLAQGIAASDLSAPDLRHLATLAANPARDDQFTAIRPALTGNYVLLVGKVVVASAAVAAFGSFVTPGHPGWLAAHAADILIAARGWGAPYVAWIAPILDRAQLMVVAARQTAARLRDTLPKG